MEGIAAVSSTPLKHTVAYLGASLVFGVCRLVFVVCRLRAVVGGSVRLVRTETSHRGLTCFLLPAAGYGDVNLNVLRSARN